MKKGDISILALLSMGIIVLGTVALNMFNPRSQDIRSSAEAQPTLTPIPTTAFSTHCGDTSWSCTVNGVFNCANKDTRDIFDSVYCCGRDRWLYENANNYGNPGSCGGGPSKTKSAGCQPSDYCQDAQTTPTTAQPTTGLTPSATPVPPTSTFAPTQPCRTPHDWARCTTVGGEYCQNWGNPSSCGWNGGLAWIDCKTKCETPQKPKTPPDPIACTDGGIPCKDSFEEVYKCGNQDLIKRFEKICGTGYLACYRTSVTSCTFNPLLPFPEYTCQGVAKINLTNCQNTDTQKPDGKSNDDHIPFCPSGSFAYYSQRESSYSNIILFPPNCTVKSKGCLQVALAMALNCTKDASINPKTLIDRYFKPWNRCGANVTDMTNVLVKNNMNVAEILPSTPMTLADKQLIKDRIKGGSYVLLTSEFLWPEVDKRIPHVLWVTDVDENNELWIMDPWNGYKKPYPMKLSDVQYNGKPRPVWWTTGLIFRPK